MYLKGFLAEFNQSLQARQRKSTGLHRDDLESFSNLQINNFIRGIQEKKEQEAQELLHSFTKNGARNREGAADQSPDRATAQLLHATAKTDAQLAQEFLPSNILKPSSSRASPRGRRNFRTRGKNNL